jgi:hypothetical protein
MWRISRAQDLDGGGDTRVLMAHLMKWMMCSRVVGPVNCHKSICAWVSCSTVTPCPAVSQLLNSIVTVTVCLARRNAESVTVHRAEPFLEVPPDESGDHFPVFVGGDAQLGCDHSGLKPGQLLVT